MPRPRFLKLPPDKQHRILETAAVEFATRGYDTASLNRIIRAARISKGAAYYYFDDKADLFAAVVAYGWQEVLPKTETDITRLTRRSFWPTLRRLADDFRRHAEARPWIMAFGMLIYGPPPSTSAARIVEQELERARRWLGALIAHGQKIGAVRRDLPAELLLMMLSALIEASDRWFVRHAATIGEHKMEALGSEILAMLERIAAPQRKAAR